MEATYFSKEWDDAPMPYAIFFTPQGHAIHGTLETGRLGTRRLARLHSPLPDNAAKLYQLVSAEGMGHTTVVVTGDVQFPQVLSRVARQRVLPAAAHAAAPAESLLDDFQDAHELIAVLRRCAAPAMLIAAWRPGAGWAFLIARHRLSRGWNLCQAEGAAR